MLKSMGIEWALAGHSERRTLNGESDEEINKQCRMLIENGMNVVLCIGETLEEFEKGLVGAVCEIQLKKNLEGISAEQMKQVTIAYEVSFMSRFGCYPLIFIEILILMLCFISLFGRLEQEK